MYFHDSHLCYSLRKPTPTSPLDAPECTLQQLFMFDMTLVLQTSACLRACCGTTDKILTGNHWGIAVLLLVAVFVGTEALHKACVALSQKLVKQKAKTTRSENRIFCPWEPLWVKIKHVRYTVSLLTLMNNSSSFSSIMSTWRSGGSDITCEQLVSLLMWKSRSLMKHSSSFAWSGRGDRHDYYR